MKPLYTQSTWESTKYSEPLKLQCQQCNKEFTRTKIYIQTTLRSKSKMLNFCCVQCKNEANRIYAKCEECGKDVSYRPSVYKAHKNHFCSSSCAAKFRNKNGTWGAATFKFDETGRSRSQLEQWIEQQLTTRYAQLEIHYSRRDTINGELDIYIPSLKLAFELNGPFHYEPIFGEKKLENVKNNDERKYQACLERGIELCVIDTSHIDHIKYRKVQKFEPILNIITPIIDRKQSILDGTYVGENI